MKIMDLDKHIGKQLVRVDIEALASPAFEVILPAGMDAEKCIGELQTKLRECIASHFDCPLEWSITEEIKVSVLCSTIIAPLEEREKAFKDFMMQIAVDGERQLQERMANGPDNGKFGYWHVSGVRHDCYVKTYSAPTAIAKAIEKGPVDDWESPSAYYIGDKLPDDLVIE